MDLFAEIYDLVLDALGSMQSENILPKNIDFKNVTVELPRDSLHGDMSTNAAMVLAKQANLKPREIAEILIEKLKSDARISTIEVAGPGFLNLTLKKAIWLDLIPQIIRLKSDFGKSLIGGNKKVNIEFVSANPTGPLHVGHTRGAVFGDALAVSLLEHRGFTKDDFAKSHPAGQLGKKLTTLVKDIAIIDDGTPIVPSDATLKDALIEITEKKLGITLVSKSKKIIGIFTDGDLRRCLNQEKDLVKTSIGTVMTNNFKSIAHDALAIDAAEIMEKNKIFTLVVTHAKDNTSGIITMHQLLESGII